MPRTLTLRNRTATVVAMTRMTPTRRHLAGAGLVALLTAVTYGASAQAPDGAGTDSDADPGTIMPPHAPPPREAAPYTACDA